MLPHRFEVAFSLLLAVVIPACASDAVDNGDLGRPPPTLETPIGPPPNKGSVPACSPQVTDLVPTEQPQLFVECPTGWSPRDGATPVSGRFKTSAELVDALCITTESSMDPRELSSDLEIDFAKYDVFATPYDTGTAEAPIVARRNANELWVRVLETCSERPALSTALFLVPKAATVDEQRCGCR